MSDNILAEMEKIVQAVANEHFQNTEHWCPFCNAPVFDEDRGTFDKHEERCIVKQAQALLSPTPAGEWVIVRKTLVQKAVELAWDFGDFDLAREITAALGTGGVEENLITKQEEPHDQT